MGYLHSSHQTIPRNTQEEQWINYDNKKKTGKTMMNLLGDPRTLSWLQETPILSSDLLLKNPLRQQSLLQLASRLHSKYLLFFSPLENSLCLSNGTPLQNQSPPPNISNGSTQAPPHSCLSFSLATPQSNQTKAPAL